VYFATYEAVKHAMGGNEGLKHEHHPLAAGTVLSFAFVDKATSVNLLLAVSGASATIASDALMNPFDGKIKKIRDFIVPMLTILSD